MGDDNRIRLDQTPVDFTAADDVDQLHSDYPNPNTQARFDFMRSFLIGLLSHQSSSGEDEPFEKRIGTTWFNKTLGLMLLYDGEEFDSISKYLSVESADDEGTVGMSSLQSIIDDIMSSLAFTGPKVVWSGVFTADEVDSIPIPIEFQEYSATNGMQAFVYIEGLLVDPRKTIIDSQTPNQINLVGVNSEPNQTFTVKLEKITAIKSETVPAEG